jgi:surfactin synthase thioesterase subunit
MGALLAFELARRMQAEGRAPVALFVSGFPAPHLPPVDEGVSRLDDEALLEELRRDGGSAAQAMVEPELWALLAPTVRADFRLCETYAHAPGAPLACDIVAFAGEEDRRTPPEQVAGWADHTAGRFSLTVVPGGHLFVETSRDEVVAHVGRACEDLLGSGASPPGAAP